MVSKLSVREDTLASVQCFITHREEYDIIYITSRMNYNLFEKVIVGLVEQRVRNENECSLPRNYIFLASKLGYRIAIK